MVTFSCYCFGVCFWFRTALVILRIAECKESPPYFKAFAVIASSGPDDLSFFIDFIAVMNSSFVKFDMFMFRICDASGMFDVSTKSLELFKTSSKYFSHFSTTHLYMLEDLRFFIHICCTAYGWFFCYVSYDGKYFGWLVFCCCFFGFNTLLLQIIIPVVHHWLFNRYCSLSPW